MVKIINLSLVVNYLLFVKSKTMLGNSLSIHPHSFANIPLMSTIGNTSETIKNLGKILSEKKHELMDAKDALEILNKALDLDKKLSDKTKNSEMNRIIEYYSHFFDEESGNNRKQGIKQVLQELKQDFRVKNIAYNKAKQDFEKVRNSSAAEASNINSSNILPIIYVNFIPFNREILLYLFRCVLPLIGILISLDIFSITISQFIDLGPFFTNLTRFIISF